MIGSEVAALSTGAATLWAENATFLLLSPVSTVCFVTDEVEA